MVPNVSEWQQDSAALGCAQSLAPLTSFAHLMCRGWHHDLVTGLSPVQAREMELSVKPAVQITMVHWENCPSHHVPAKSVLGTERSHDLHVLQGLGKKAVRERTPP